MPRGAVRLGAIWLRAAACAVALATLMSGAGSSAAATAPRTVRFTSFDLVGQNLVWRAQLSRPFTAARLANQKASLCLLINRGSTKEKVCLTPPTRGSSLVVSYQGRQRRIVATVTRPTPTTMRAQFLPAAIGVRNQNFVWATEITAPGSASVVPTGGQEMNLRPYRVAGCVATGPKLIYNGPRAAKVVALTFDDGPWFDTPDILNILEQKRVVATFFQVGERVARFAAVDRRMLRDGDAVGNHTWDHPDLKLFRREISTSEITRTSVAIQKATGFRPCLFRFPYGEFTQDEIDDTREVGLNTVLWDVDTRDWSKPGVDAIYNKVVSLTQPRSIILHHDGTEPGVRRRPPSDRRVASARNRLPPQSGIQVRDGLAVARIPVEIQEVDGAGQSGPRSPGYAQACERVS